MDVYLPQQQILKTSAPVTEVTDDVESSDRGETGDVSTIEKKEIGSSKENGVQLKRNKKNKKPKSEETNVDASSTKVKKIKFT